MNESADFQLDKRRLRRSFNQAAASYENAAVLAREVDARMRERLALIRLTPGVILDAGAGCGGATRGLLERYPGSRVIALDFAAAMLRRISARGRWFRKPALLCADAEVLPLADDCIDLIYSNMLLPWCNTLDATFAEFQRVLRPGGLLMFSSAGPDTLMELRQAWATADDYIHVNAFIDMHDVGDALMRAGFADPVMDVERITLTYPSLDGLRRDLKDLGAGNYNVGRARGLLGRQRLQRMKLAYEQWRNADGLLPATCEVVYGHAWAAASRQAAPGGHDGHEVNVAFERAGRRRR